MQKYENIFLTVKNRKIIFQMKYHSVIVSVLALDFTFKNKLKTFSK